MESNSAQNLTKLYVTALGAIAVLVIIGQVLLQWTLSREEGDARIINLAGRQRMLSQKLCKSVLAIEFEKDASQQENRMNEFEKDIELFSSIHQGLQNGDASLGLSGKNSPAIKRLFQQIKEPYDSLSIAASQFLATRYSGLAAGNSAQRSEYVSAMLAAESGFLKGMDDIVFQMDKESSGKVKAMKWESLTLLVIVLVVLFAQGRYIFRPAIGKLSETLAHLVQSQKHNDALMERLHETGMDLNLSVIKISSASQEQKNATSKIATAISEVGATSQEISATTKKLAETMQQVRKSSVRTTELASSSLEGLSLMEETIRKITSSGEEIGHNLDDLDNKAKIIVEVLKIITTVADQTNLLSLNAAIEANRAGDAGLGFAIVATEIRRLADQTAGAVTSIEQRVQGILSSIKSNVGKMGALSGEMHHGVEGIRKVGGQLKYIIQNVQALTPQFETVNEGVQSQVVGSEQINDSLSDLNRSMQQILNSLEDFNASIKQLKSRSGTLVQLQLKHRETAHSEAASLS